MDIDAWLDVAIADAKRRGLPELEPLLRALARSTEMLRNTEFDGPLFDELSAHERRPRRADD